MIPFFVGFLTWLSAFFRSRYNLTLEILALRQQLGVLKREILALDYESRIEHFGYCLVGFGLRGATSWSLSNRKPLLLGIGLAFGCSGAFDPVPNAMADQKQMPSYGV